MDFKGTDERYEWLSHSFTDGCKIIVREGNVIEPKLTNHLGSFRIPNRSSETDSPQRQETSLTPPLSRQKHKFPVFEGKPSENHFDESIEMGNNQSQKIRTKKMEKTYTSVTDFTTRWRDPNTTKDDESEKFRMRDWTPKHSVDEVKYGRKLFGDEFARRLKRSKSPLTNNYTPLDELV
jgi:hypothetical protein